MNRAVLRLAALVLPLAGFGVLWLMADAHSRGGSEWDVPVQGYDPRDLLQGHYVQFQYDWSRLRNYEEIADSAAMGLCLIGEAPRIDRVEPADAAVRCPGRYVAAGQRHQGRLYTSQAEAQRLQQQLNQPGNLALVQIRLSSDGSVTPIGFRFRPRP